MEHDVWRHYGSQTPPMLDLLGPEVRPVYLSLANAFAPGENATTGSFQVTLRDLRTGGMLPTAGVLAPATYDSQQKLVQVPVTASGLPPERYVEMAVSFTVTTNTAERRAVALVLRRVG